MSERVLLGPFLLHQEAATRAGVSHADVRHRPDLLRVKGPWTPEVYFAFQFNEFGIVRDLARVVLTLRAIWDDLTIADWLVRPNSVLGGDAPLHWVKSGRGSDRIREAVMVASETGSDRRPTSGG